MSARTYYFAIPEVDRPVGGVNVAFQIASSLRRDGYDCRMLQATRDYGYAFFETDVPSSFAPELAPVLRPRTLRQRIRGALRAPAVSVRPPRQAERLALRPRDVVVAPDYLYPDFVRLFPDAPKILNVQVMTGIANAMARCGSLAPLRAYDAVVATSEACAEFTREIIGIEPHRITLNVASGHLAFEREKKRQVAYMPRKRTNEVRIAVEALRPFLEGAGMTLCEISGMKPPQVAQALKDSLFFLSFSEGEGFGLPPAEAMLAGCIVVGYTGIGGNEFFTAETGVVVPEGDTVAMVRAVKRLVAEYAENPAPLDQMREKASRKIAERYSQAAFENSLLGAWSEIDREVGSAPARK